MAKAKVKIKLEGADDVLRAFNKFDKESRVNLRKSVKSNAISLRQKMRGRIHNVTGNLSESLTNKYSKDGLSADVGPTRPKGSHAHLVEFGTVNAPAHPFITPSAEEQRPKYLNDVRQSVKGAIPRG